MLVGWLHTREIDMRHFVNTSLGVAVAKCWYLGFVVPDRTSLCLSVS